MTYDFFGTPWAETLGHHTNRKALEEGGWAVETIVDHLLAEGFSADRINIGYAGYTRNARQVEIESLSPLKGSYNPGTGDTTGSFESGTSEWYDVIYSYLDLENQKGRNGFNVYTDQVADADYLYSPESKLFLSLDTPRTVKAKGEYAAKLAWAAYLPGLSIRITACWLTPCVKVWVMKSNLKLSIWNRSTSKVSM